MNCGITPEALTNANAIFGPQLPGVMGKTVSQKPERVTTKGIQIPRGFQRFQMSVTLVADVLFVNEIPFLITLSSRIKKFTVEHI